MLDIEIMFPEWKKVRYVEISGDLPLAELNGLFGEITNNASVKVIDLESLSVLDEKLSFDEQGITTGSRLAVVRLRC